MKSAWIHIALSAIWITSVSLQSMAAGQSEIDLLSLPLNELVKIRVTAARTGLSDIQETPIAITIISGIEFEQSIARDIRDLAHNTPGLVISQNLDFGQLYIRGVGSNNIFAGAEPSTTIHMDGVYLARPVGLFDRLQEIERIEILRGPQGSLYGRNSAGGTINIITKKPNLMYDQIKLQAIAGNYGEHIGKAYITKVLTQDELAFSFGIQYANHDGYRMNITPTGNDAGDENSFGIRGQLHWDNNEKLTATLRGDYMRDTGVQYGYQSFLEPVTAPLANEIVGDYKKIAGDFPGYTAKKNWGLALDVTYQINDNWHLQSLTAFRESYFDAGLDTDATELDIIRTFITENQDQLSQEITLHGTAGKLHVLAGLFYFRENLELLSTFELRALNVDRHPEPLVDTKAYAIFTNIQYDITSKLTLDIGARYSWDGKEYTKNDGLFDPATGAQISDLSLPTEDRMDKIFTPKLGLTLKASESLYLYAVATRGFKSGGYNFVATKPGGFRPETLWSYEVGLKGTFLNNRLEMSATAFHYDYNDLQVQAFVTAGTVDISNAATANISGIELEARVAPTKGMQISVSAAYLHARYASYIDAPIAGGTSIDATGNTLNNAPTLSGSANFQYGQKIANGYIQYRANVAAQSRIYFTVDNNNVETQDTYVIANASIAYHWADDRYSLALWGRNIFDTQYITGSASFTPSPAGHAGMPATFGLRLALQY